MSTVNGVGNTATYGKFQEVGTTSQARGARGPQRGGVIGNGRTQRPDAGNQIRQPKEKNDTLKEIATLLKGLIESISAMLAKLMGSAVSSANAESNSGATSTTGNGTSTSTTSNGADSAASGSSTTGSSASADSTGSAATTTTGTTGSSTTGSGTTTATDGAGAAADGTAANGSSTTSTTSTGTGATGTTTTGATTTPADDLETRETSGVATTTATEVKTEGEDAGLQALKDETGAISVVTPDGFSIRAEGRDQAWTILGPDGFKTRIWGDPHVSESDGDTWDFLEQSTFKFGNNKVTVEVVPAGNGTTYSARITVYNGKDRVTISGINSDKPTIDAVAKDGVQHDAQLSDGTVLERGVNTRGESWSKTVDGKKDVMGH